MATWLKQPVTLVKKISQTLTSMPAKLSESSHKNGTTKSKGDAAEDLALKHLQAAGLKLLERNYRTPGRGGGEIDLIMRDVEGTLVFVEVRQRSGGLHGGAAASISATKQKRIIFAARRYLMRLGHPPACRFDVVLLEGQAQNHLTWLKAAFDAS